MISATATTAGSVDMLALKSTVELLAGEYVVSFWAKAETAGTLFNVYFYNPNTTTSGTASNGAITTRVDGQVDTGVNCGTGFAKPLLQRALNLLNNQGKAGWPDLAVDGIYGPATLNALKTYLAKRGKEGEKVLVRVLNIIQGQRYIEICERNPSQEQFFYGWIANRVVI
ncbi:putative peptidoglycan-binding domain-containing protein [Acinetobacter pittii]|nr:putative peptidoglycan-binding domain-containing protein [Acinetobacter pittii]